MPYSHAEILARLAAQEDMAPGPAFTHYEIEAALNVWEHVLDTVHACAGTEPRGEECRAEPWNANLLASLEGNGYAEVRYWARGLGTFVAAAYDHLPEEVREMGSYDWEIVPVILRQIDFAKLPGWDNLPEIEAVAAEAAKRLRMNDWASQVNSRLVNRFGISLHDAGLSAEEINAHAESALASGQDPAEWVNWFMVKYDLTPKSSGW